MSLPAGAVTVPLPGGARAVLAEEVPVALVFDGVTQAVMMASPVDLEDFLLGFALTEGMIADRAELLRHEVVRQPQGIELRGWLAAPAPLADGALAALRAGQSLQDAVRSVHAAGFWDGAQMRALREDVGRHNALDKLAGALAGQGIDAAAGALVLTSRLSVDLVQKAAMIGARVLIAPSAPTALAVAEAQAAGLALIARGPDGPTLYTETEAE